MAEQVPASPRGTPARRPGRVALPRLDGFPLGLLSSIRLMLSRTARSAVSIISRACSMSSAASRLSWAKSPAKPGEGHRCLYRLRPAPGPSPAR